MAKNCSRCGKQLSFRDSFVLDGKPICKSCLNEAEGGAPSTAAPPDESLRGMGGWLLFFVVMQCFVSAIINFGFVIVAMNDPEIVTNTTFDLAMSIFGVVTGLMLINRRDRSAVLTAKLYMATYLVGAVLAALIGFHPPAGYYVSGGDRALWNVVMRAVASNLVWQSYFLRSRRVKATYLDGSPKAQQDRAALLPREVDCPNCGTALTLNEDERVSRKFTCPICGKDANLEASASAAAA